MKRVCYTPVSFKIGYSEAFKRQVVREVMSGILTKDGARRKYNIGGKTTVLGWCRKYGSQEELGIKVKIMTQREEDENTILKRRIKELEKSLEKSQFKNEALETLIDVAEQELDIKIRKKSGAKQ